MTHPRRQHLLQLPGGQPHAFARSLPAKPGATSRRSRATLKRHPARITCSPRALTDWLSPAYGPGLELEPDLDDIEALSPERDALWSRLEKTSFLTDDEKRASIDYGPKGSSAPEKFNPNHDDRGRFDFGPGDGVTPVANAPKDPIQGKPRALGDGGGGGGGAGGRSTGDILKPGGKDVGTAAKGAGSDIRTVSPGDFNAIKRGMMDGATELPARADYAGKTFVRPDGSIFGLRVSPQSGETLDIFKSGVNSNVSPGYKVHVQ